MIRNSRTILPVAALFIFIILFSYRVNGQTESPVVTPATTFKPLADVCNGHGGVNCTIESKERELTCYDGTVIKEVSIWETKDCQDQLNSDINFSFDNYCPPPAEFSGCKDQAGYDAVKKSLEDRGVLDSELGKNEMLVCAGQKTHYEEVADNFKQCFLKENRAVTTTKLIFDILLTYLYKLAPGDGGLCSITAGEKSFFNTKTESCQCKPGYYMKDSQTENTECLSGAEMCKELHGDNVIEKNGNCLCAEGYVSVGGAVCIKLEPTTPSPVSAVRPTPIPTLESTPIYVRPLPVRYSGPSPLPATASPVVQTGENTEQPGFLIKLFSKIVKLFCFGFCD